MIDKTSCEHKLLKYIGQSEGIESKAELGTCIDCHLLIQVNDSYKLIPTGKYDLYRRRDGK